MIVLVRLAFWTCPEQNEFRKVDLFPSSGGKAGSTYSVGSIRKS
jgi:hypothetical protein